MHNSNVIVLFCIVWLADKKNLLNVAVGSLPHVVELDHTGKRLPGKLWGKKSVY